MYVVVVIFFKVFSKLCINLCIICYKNINNIKTKIENVFEVFLYCKELRNKISLTSTNKSTWSIKQISRYTSRRNLTVQLYETNFFFFENGSLRLNIIREKVINRMIQRL